jgi:hypothetical protein
MTQPSTILVWSFIAVTLAVATGIVAIGQKAFRRGSIAGYFLTVWLGMTVALAGHGMLRFDTRPSMLVIIAAAIGLALYVSLSKIGARVAGTIPMAALVVFQAFRLPLALVLNSVAPYEGWTFDILAGATAIVVALLANYRHVVLAWNIAGTMLLATVVTMPRDWMTRPPFVWLVALLVPAALAGHILVFRKWRNGGLKPAAPL